MIYEEKKKNDQTDQGFLCFITPVWGEEYVDFFLDYCLPSQLSKNNIPGLKRKVKYVIATSSQDIFRIINSPAYKLLKNYVDEVSIIEVYQEGLNHDLMSNCYKKGMKKFKHLDVPFVFLTPDFVIADGTFANMENIINSGKRVIYLPGLRLIKEKGMRLLRPYFKKTHEVLEISSARLMQIALKIIHEWGYASFLEEGGAAWLPSNIYWRVGTEGLLAHCFHLHPLVVWPRKRNVDFKGTIDDDLVEQCDFSADDIHIVRDSRELLICEFSKEDRPCKTSIAKGYMPHLIQWMRMQTQKNHRELFMVPIYMHCGKMTPDLWQQAIDKSQNYVQDVQRAYLESKQSFSLWVRTLCRNRFLLCRSVLFCRGLYFMVRGFFRRHISYVIGFHP